MITSTRTRRRRDIEQELDETLDSDRPREPAPADQMLALQRHAGNQAVARMLREAPRSRPARQELAQRAADDASVLDAIRGAASLRAPATAGLLQDPTQDGGTPDLHQAHPGIVIGQGDGTEVATPGITAPEADTQIAAVEGPEDAQTATENPVDAAPGAVPEAATPESEEERRTEPDGSEPDATTPPFQINSRTDMKAPDGSPDTRKKVAMGEVIYFDVGGRVVDWTASAGWPPRRRGRSTYAWELPEPGTATITATDPDTGETASVDIEAVAPDDLKMVKLSEDVQAPGTGGAGMILSPRFGPRNVNFGNVEWLEQPGGPSSVTGYFADLQAAGADWNHYPNPDFLRINRHLTDHAAIFGLPAPFKAGSFHWEIPNAFRRAATRGSGEVTVTSRQSFSIQANGTVTVSKQGASVTRAP